MALGRLRRDCAALVDELDIPAPFDVQELCQSLASKRGRSIRLAAMAMPTDGPCGVWVSVNDADYVLYEERTSRLHQEHIILHELGHVVCRHQAAPVLDSETAAFLLPSLDPAMIERVLGRTGYSAHEEQQAEMIASLILQQVSDRSSEPSPTVDPEVTGIVDRLELSLANRPRRRADG
jgi:hypothetical protein